MTGGWCWNFSVDQAACHCTGPSTSISHSQRMLKAPYCDSANLVMRNGLGLHAAAQHRVLDISWRVWPAALGLGTLFDPSVASGCTALSKTSASIYEALACCMRGLSHPYLRAKTLQAIRADQYARKPGCERLRKQQLMAGVACGQCLRIDSVHLVRRRQSDQSGAG